MEKLRFLPNIFLFCLTKKLLL
uniref:Uncharacterized protein n=1 Tax=Rhizophora mucronata TaxID=61149 RepID=A0A2P2IT26_RHIMU